MEQRVCGGTHRWSTEVHNLRFDLTTSAYSTDFGSLCILFTLLFLIASSSVCTAQSSHWVTGYYAGWQLGNGSNGYLPASKVDFSTMTHVIHFAIVPKPDGSLDTVSNTITFEGSAALVKAAHEAGASVLICVGGAGTEPAFMQATNSGNIDKFVGNITAFVQSRGYDGVDVDWEPIDPYAYGQFTTLASQLRASLNAISNHEILTTTCVDGNQKLMSMVQQYFDQINIMTYDMSIPSQGWVSWYNSPVYNGGVKFPGLNEYVPSIDATVKDYEAAGVPPNKIGIGAEFGGTVWGGVTLPDQSLGALSSMAYDVPLYTADGKGIMQKYYSSADYHWDDKAEAGYLSDSKLLGLIGGFVSYDDSNSLGAKAAYIRKENLGGIILYELGMGYPGKGNYPLLEAVKSEFSQYLYRPIVQHQFDFELDQNFPNPFNPATRFTFNLAQPANVKFKIYNALGEQVAYLISWRLGAGEHVVEWNGYGHPSGVYFYRLQVDGISLTRKMLLVK